MSLDLDNLEIVYKKYYEISLQIKELIERKLYNELAAFISKKEMIFQEAQVFVERIQKNNEDASRLAPLCQLIHNQEKENIELLSAIREDIKQEMRKINKNTKLMKAYSLSEKKQGSILDFREWKSIYCLIKK